jgi:predicted metal-dependent hydrolase
MPVVQLRLPLQAPRESSHRTVTAAGRVYGVVIARHRQARRYVLRLVNEETLRLTVPRGASIASGLRFAAKQTSWIAREHGRLCTKAAPWRHGTTVFFRGERVALGVLHDEVTWCGERVALETGDLDVRGVVQARMRSIAEDTLPARCFELAGVHGLRIARVSVRDQRSRWGACSSRRAITLNWRLVQMPVSVSDYVILHELMHLRQPNHSPRFWREVSVVCPDWRDAERWLRRHGREIL